MNLSLAGYYFHNAKTFLTAVVSLQKKLPVLYITTYMLLLLLFVVVVVVF